MLVLLANIAETSAVCIVLEVDLDGPLLRVTTFNSGLFDPARHPFLKRYTVGDARLIEALDKLARVDGQFVDFRDLAARHLGTIYEGLLEYHLQPIGPEGGWTVDLFNNRGECHRIGSYYRSPTACSPTTDYGRCPTASRTARWSSARANGF